MRHQKVGRKLSRTASHRKALFSALSTALIKHKRIRTTTAKAKEMRRYVEPMITRAKKAYLSEQSGNPVDVHSRRLVSRVIRDRDALQILFGEIAEKVAKRNGGYTRVLKLGRRYGDNAELSVIELVDYNEAQDTKKRKERAEKSKLAALRRKTATEKKVVKETAVEKEEIFDEYEVVDEPAADAAGEQAAPETPEGDETPSAEASPEAKK